MGGGGRTGRAGRLGGTYAPALLGMLLGALSGDSRAAFAATSAKLIPVEVGALRGSLDAIAGAGYLRPDLSTLLISGITWGARGDGTSHRAGQPPGRTAAEQRSTRRLERSSLRDVLNTIREIFVFVFPEQHSQEVETKRLVRCLVLDGREKGPETWYELGYGQTAI